MIAKMGKSSRGLFLLTVICLLGWLLVFVGREWRDWQHSDEWQRVTTTTFAIQPKSSRVTYHYAVNGTTYRGQRTHFFVIAPFQDSRVLNWIDENRDATTLTVYYDPDTPIRSVVVREVEAAWAGQWLLICGVALLFGVLPLIFFGGLWRWLWRQFARVGDS